jgi:hypothetical protein
MNDDVNDRYFALDMAVRLQVAVLGNGRVSTANYTAETLEIAKKFSDYVRGPESGTVVQLVKENEK